MRTLTTRAVTTYEEAPESCVGNRKPSEQPAFDITHLVEDI